MSKPSWAELRRRLPDPSRVKAACKHEFAALDGRQLGLESLARLLPDMAFSRTRSILYRLAGVGIGEHTLVSSRLHLLGPPGAAANLTVGSYCWLNGPIFLDVSTTIRIGNHVTVGNHVVFTTAHHDIGPTEHRAGPVRPRPISIGDGAWIASCVTVLPGAKVGAGTVIAAGSVVVGEIPPNVLAGGVPARVIRNLDAAPSPSLATGRKGMQSEVPGHTVTKPPGR